MTEFTRQQLYDQVWSKPAVKLAKEVGVSDVAISKVCKRHEIPKPSLGYWAKIAHGKKVAKPPLPKLDDPGLEIICFNPVSDQLRARERSDETNEKMKAEKADENKIVVSDKLDAPHPLVARTEKSLRSAAKNKEGLVRPKAKDCLEVIIGPDSIDRAMRIMDALLKGIEVRGMKITTHDEATAERPLHCLRTYQSTRNTFVEIKGERLILRLTESIGELAVPLTAAQKKENARYRYFPTFPTHEKYPRGFLCITIKCDVDPYINRRWSELDGKRLEDRLNSMVAWMYLAVERREYRRREQEEWERRRVEDERLRAAAEERRRKEEARIAALEGELAAWHKAERIRRYVDAVEQTAIRKHDSIAPDSELAQWMKWARSRADALDPLT